MYLRSPNPASATGNCRLPKFAILSLRAGAALRRNARQIGQLRSDGLQRKFVGPFAAISMELT